jgi:hypothetical protein
VNSLQSGSTFLSVISSLSGKIDAAENEIAEMDEMEFQTQVRLFDLKLI